MQPAATSPRTAPTTITATTPPASITRTEVQPPTAPASANTQGNDQRDGTTTPDGPNANLPAGEEDAPPQPSTNRLGGKAKHAPDNAHRQKPPTEAASPSTQAAPPRENSPEQNTATTKSPHKWPLRKANMQTKPTETSRADIGKCSSTRASGTCLPTPPPLRNAKENGRTVSGATTGKFDHTSGLNQLTQTNTSTGTVRQLRPDMQRT